MTRPFRSWAGLGMMECDMLSGVGTLLSCWFCEASSERKQTQGNEPQRQGTWLANPKQSNRQKESGSGARGEENLLQAGGFPVNDASASTKDRRSNCR